ncbi:serine-rich adhesin for platelets [Biomphalaria pfeifferi]|uniref:Serine-rich adhesin for platelets n=1 Tax=Biomphalaria pfeifferi TaxID=112525 RepID=A0AAD8B0U4_BIOPF|nr:serine-rich adhesin for platelets [Biomphalaria pfeifferi]
MLRYFADWKKMRIRKDSMEYTPSKSATDKNGAEDHNQDTAEAQMPEKKVQPDKTLISPSRDSNRRTGKNKKKQRKNKGAVTEDHKKLEITVQSVVKGAKLEIGLDKKESDDGFTKVVRKHRPRRNVSSLDKTASNKDKTRSTGSENRKKESTRARRKPFAANTDIKKKEKAAESSLSKTPQNKGRSLTATTGNRKKESTSTKATPRNTKRSKAPRAARSKDQSHTSSTRKTNLSTSRPASKHPSAEKHQLSDRSEKFNPEVLPAVITRCLETGKPVSAREKPRNVRVTSEDNDVGLISQESSDMSSYSQAIPSVKKKYSKSKATLVKSLIFESSILGVNKQSTCSPLEEDQDLVFSSSDDLSDVGWTSPEA